MSYFFLLVFTLLLSYSYMYPSNVLIVHIETYLGPYLNLLVFIWWLLVPTGTYPLFYLFILVFTLYLAYSYMHFYCI